MKYSRIRANCSVCTRTVQCILHDNLGNETLERLTGAASRVEYEAGERIFFEGQEAQSLIMLCRGEIDLEKTGADGETLRVKRILPGAMLGARALLSDKVYSSTAVAVTSVEAARIPGPTFFKSVGGNPELLMAVARVMADEVRQLGNMAWSMAYRSAEQRVAETLYLISRADGTTTVHCKRRDVAERAGLAIETTVRVLKKMESRGLVKLARGHIEVCDLEALADLAQLA